MITHQRLRELLHYDPLTGIFLRLVSANSRVKVGDIAGSLHKATGYRRIQIDGRDYMAHRLAWFYVTGEWPTADIDHWNLNRTDNRFCNLREATNSENHANMRARADNTSGFKGVYFHKPNRKWVTQITVIGKRIYLGSFDTKGSAHAAYAAAAKQHFGEFARLS